MPALDTEVQSQPHLRAYSERFDLVGASAEAVRINIARERTQDPDHAAEEWHAVWVPNGDFAVEMDGVRYEYRIHLVERGQLSGKRIIKVKHPGQPIYTGFAFLTRSGGFALWQRFRRSAQEPYVIAANALVHVLNLVSDTDNASTNMARWNGAIPIPWDGEVLIESGLSETLHTARVEVRFLSLRCSHCNRTALRVAPHFALCADHTYVAGPDPALQALIDEDERQERRDRATRQSTRPSTARTRRRPAQSRTEADGPLMSEVGGRIVR